MGPEQLAVVMKMDFGMDRMLDEMSLDLPVLFAIFSTVGFFWTSTTFLVKYRYYLGQVLTLFTAMALIWTHYSSSWERNPP